jgi:hypothetical protein
MDLQGASNGHQKAQQDSLQQQEQNAETETGRRAEGVPAGAARTPVESEAPVELAGERPAKNRQGQTGANHRLVTRLVGRVRSWGSRRLRICWSRCDSRRLTGPGRRRRYQNPPFP